MARCRCGQLACSCALKPGPGIIIDGNGDSDNPYVISGEPLSTGTIAVTDTPSVNLTLAGGGTVGNPYVISGEAIIGALIQLVDDGDIIFDVTGSGSLDDPLVVSARLRCIDCSADADTGDVPMWNEALGTFVPTPAPTAPFGTLITEGGLIGTGTVANPVRVDICTYDELAAACETF